MPNLNAALLCAQLEQLNSFLENKRELASIYETFFRNTDITFVKEIGNATANYLAKPRSC
jgi:perosamine synthetase